MKKINYEELSQLTGGSWFSNTFYFLAGYVAGQIANGMDTANRAALTNGGYPMAL